MAKKFDNVLDALNSISENTEDTNMSVKDLVLQRKREDEQDRRNRTLKDAKDKKSTLVKALGMGSSAVKAFDDKTGMVSKTKELLSSIAALSALSFFTDPNFSKNLKEWAAVAAVAIPAGAAALTARKVSRRLNGKDGNLRSGYRDAKAAQDLKNRIKALEDDLKLLREQQKPNTGGSEPKVEAETPNVSESSKLNGKDGDLSQSYKTTKAEVDANKIAQAEVERFNRQAQSMDFDAKDLPIQKPPTPLSSTLNGKDGDLIQSYKTTYAQVNADKIAQAEIERFNRLAQNLSVDAKDLPIQTPATPLSSTLNGKDGDLVDGYKTAQAQVDANKIAQTEAERFNRAAENTKFNKAEMQRVVAAQKAKAPEIMTDIGNLKIENTGVRNLDSGKFIKIDDALDAITKAASPDVLKSAGLPTAPTIDTASATPKFIPEKPSTLGKAVNNTLKVAGGAAIGIDAVQGAATDIRKKQDAEEEVNNATVTSGALSGAVTAPFALFDMAVNGLASAIEKPYNKVFEAVHGKPAPESGSLNIAGQMQADMSTDLQTGQKALGVGQGTANEQLVDGILKTDKKITDTFDKVIKGFESIGSWFSGGEKTSYENPRSTQSDQIAEATVMSQYIPKSTLSKNFAAGDFGINPRLQRSAERNQLISDIVNAQNPQLQNRLVEKLEELIETMTVEEQKTSAMVINQVTNNSNTSAMIPQLSVDIPNYD